MPVKMFASQETLGKPATQEVKGMGRIATAVIPQGYDTKINIRILPGSNVRLKTRPAVCKSRKGAPRRDTEPVPLPGGLIPKLNDANDKMISWLTQDEGNPRYFLEHPVQALIKAGVDLTRVEEKALDRLHQLVKETRVIGPGVKIIDLSTSMNPNGRVAEPQPISFTTSHRDKDCGCGSKGKE